MSNKNTYFVISDIHGRKISINDFKKKGFGIYNQHHKIIILGDYFDRGTNNIDVLNFLKETKKLIGDRLITLRGNHDQYLESYIECSENNIGYLSPDLFNLGSWIRNGGETTLKEFFGEDVISLLYRYEEFKNSINELGLKEWSDNLLDYYETDKYIFTHAYINKDRETDHWNRDLITNPEIAPDKKVVIGHTPTGHFHHMQLFYPDLNFIKNGTGHYNIENENILLIDDGTGKNITVLDELL